MLVGFFMASAFAAPRPFAGVEYRPLSRGDLTWVIDGNTTGLAVGPLDGLVRPALSAYVGAWVSPRWAVQGAMGTARLQSTTRAGDVVTQRHWGVVRPSVDVRFALLPHSAARPTPWAILGTWVDIPSARDTSNGFTAEEQEQADASAAQDRSRLGGVGARLGAGASVPVLKHVHLGIQAALTWRRSFFQGSDPNAATSLVAGETALLLQFEWPSKDSAESERAKR